MAEDNDNQADKLAADSAENSTDKSRNNPSEPGGHRPEENGGGAQPLPLDLPKPTVWPITFALGVTLLAFGVVTDWMLSLAGLALFLVASGGWFMDLRNEQL